MPREIINPPELFKHSHYSRVLIVDKPGRFIFIAGTTPADENYQPVAPGDYRGQYIAILETLTLQLKAAGATWDDVVFRRWFALSVPEFIKVMNDKSVPVPWDRSRPSPSTLIGVTGLSNPGFLLEMEVLAVVSGDRA